MSGQPMTTLTVGKARTMPPVDEIISYWAEGERHRELNLDSRYIGWGEPFCFACGWLPPIADGRADSWRLAARWLDRAHLADHSQGGPDEPFNLVMLCHLCHDSMPDFDDRTAAAEWVKAVPRVKTGWQMFTDHHLWGKTPSRSTTLLRARLRYTETRARALEELREQGHGEDTLRKVSEAV